MALVKLFALLKTKVTAPCSPSGLWSSARTCRFLLPVSYCLLWVLDYNSSFAIVVSTSLWSLLGITYFWYYFLYVCFWVKIHLSAEVAAQRNQRLSSGHNCCKFAILECDYKTAKASVTGIYKYKVLMTNMRAFQLPELTLLPASPVLLLPSHRIIPRLPLSRHRSCAAPLLSNGGMNFCRSKIGVGELMKSCPDTSLLGNRISGSFKSYCF